MVLCILHLRKASFIRVMIFAVFPVLGAWQPGEKQCGCGTAERDESLMIAQRTVCHEGWKCHERVVGLGLHLAMEID